MTRSVTTGHNKAHKRYNVGVLGAGRIASSVHIKNILRNRRLLIKWIVDDSQKAVAHVKEEHCIEDDIPFYSLKVT